MSTDMISFYQDRAVFLCAPVPMSRKRNMAVILSKGSPAHFLSSFVVIGVKISSKDVTQCVLPLFMSFLWWIRFRANMQPGRLMHKCSCDGMSHLFVKGSGMKEHLLWATVREGTRETLNLQAVFTWDVLNICLIFVFTCTPQPPPLWYVPPCIRLCFSLFHVNNFMIPVF